VGAVAEVARKVGVDIRCAVAVVMADGGVSSNILDPQAFRNTSEIVIIPRIF
jgi:hypothetical protein